MCTCQNLNTASTSAKTSMGTARTSSYDRISKGGILGDSPTKESASCAAEHVHDGSNLS